jgi:hypothetical protein
MIATKKITVETTSSTGYGSQECEYSEAIGIITTAINSGKMVYINGVPKDNVTLEDLEKVTGTVTITNKLDGG